MHKLEDTILAIIRNDDNGNVDHSSYVKSVEKSDIRVLDFDRVGGLISKHRFNNNYPPTVYVRMVENKRIRNYTQKCSYSYIQSSNLYVGKVKKVNPDGTVNFESYYIEPDFELNLKNKVHMEMYIQFMLSPMFMNCPFASGQMVNENPVYYIEDPIESAMAETKRANTILNVAEKIKSMSSVERLNMCRYLNLISIRDFITPELLLGKLTAYGVSSPYDFTAKYRSRDRQIMTYIQSALMLNVFEKHSDEYTYNGFPIGRNEQEMLITLQNNSEQLRYIVSEVTERDADLKKMRAYDEQQRIARQANVNNISKTIDDELALMGDDEVNQKSPEEIMIENKSSIMQKSTAIINNQTVSQDDVFADDGGQGGSKNGSLDFDGEEYR